MTAQPEDNDTPDMTPEERAEYLSAFYPDGDVIDLRDKISRRNQCIQAAEKNGNKVACDEWGTEKQDLEQQLKDLLSERKMHGLALVPETAPTPASAAPVVAGSEPDLDHCPPTPQAEDEANGTFNEAPQPVPAAPPEAVLMPAQAQQSPLDTPAPELTPATPAHVVKPKTKRRTWRDVSAHYIVEVMRAGQYATAKDLYRALEAKAGPNSPFNKGTGDNRGSLFVREIARPLSMKTVQNDWQNLLIQARK